MEAVFRNRIKEHRQRAGKTTRAVAEEMGITNGTVTLIENGQRNASDALKTRFAAYFGVPVGELFFVDTADNLQPMESAS